MAEDASTTAIDDTGAEDKKDDQTVPYERFQQVNSKAKEASERTKALEKELADLRAAAEAREAEGLPELERERKAREKAEREAAEARAEAEKARADYSRAQKERWVVSAAGEFHDPNDAVLNVNFDSIESAEDAAREVKRVAKAKKHLVKDEAAPAPQVGQVLKDGQAVKRDRPGIDTNSEAQMLAAELKKITDNWHTAS